MVVVAFCFTWLCSWTQVYTALQDPPSNWAIHHDMLTARCGSGQPDAAVFARIAPFLPSLHHPPVGGKSPSTVSSAVCVLCGRFQEVAGKVQGSVHRLTRQTQRLPLRTA